jgi:hypothetical protein
MQNIATNQKDCVQSVSHTSVWWCKPTKVCESHLSLRQSLTVQSLTQSLRQSTLRILTQSTEEGVTNTLFNVKDKSVHNREPQIGRIKNI